MRTLVIALRLLGTALLLTGSLLAGSAAAADTRPHIDVVEVNGLIDPVVADFVRSSIADAEKEKAAVLILQLSSSGGVLGQADQRRLADEIRTSKVPVAVW